MEQATIEFKKQVDDLIEEHRKRAQALLSRGRQTFLDHKINVLIDRLDQITSGGDRKVVKKRKALIQKLLAHSEILQKQMCRLMDTTEVVVLPDHPVGPRGNSTPEPERISDDDQLEIRLRIGWLEEFLERGKVTRGQLQEELTRLKQEYRE